MGGAVAIDGAYTAHRFFDAAERQGTNSEASEHCGIAAAEVQVARARSTHRATPIGAVRTDSGERSIAAVATARQCQFKLRGKCPRTIITYPTQSLVVQFRFGWNPIPARARIIHPIHALPQVVVLRASPIERCIWCQNKITMCRLVHRT